MLWKIIQYNSIHNNNGIIEYDYNIVKVTLTYEQAVKIAIELKRRTKKLYKIERV